MKANFERSLLKGVHEIPFENIAGLEEQVFNQLSVIEKFLIGDTLLTYSMSPDKYPNEIETSPQEDFPFGSPSISKHFKQLKKSSVSYVVHFLIAEHIKYRRLLHPSMIIQVLMNKNAWDDQMILLPKVLRKRARWLSSMKKDWNWWNDVLKHETWENKSSVLRNLHLIVMRTFKNEQANVLLIESWATETNDTKKLFVQIISETYQSTDNPMLLQLYNAENSKLKSQIRQLIFLFEESAEFIALKEMIKSTYGFVDKIKLLNFQKETELKSLFLDQKLGTIPTEVFFTHPFVFFSNNENRDQFREYVDSLKNKAILLNELLINYTYKRDINSLMTCIDAEMELGEGFILNNSMLKVLSNCGPEFINELLGEMLLSCNSISRWRFYYQLILYGEVSLDKKNTSSLVTLTGLYLKSSSYNKSAITEFLARACYCIHTSYLGDWTVICGDLTRQNPELKKLKVIDMIEELITFRKQIESNILHGK